MTYFTPAAIFGSSYDPGANALFARMSSQPNSARKKLISDTIVALQAASIWSKFDVLYLFAAHDSQAALLNWKSSSYNATLVSTPTFTIDRGFTCPSSTKVSGPNPTTVAGQYTINSAHFSSWSRTNRQSNSANFGGDPSTPYYVAIIRDTNNRIQSYINGVQLFSVSGSVTNSTGLFVVNKSAANDQQAYRNGTSITSNSTNSGGLPNSAIGWGGAFGTTGDGGEYAMGSMGASLSAGEQVDFYNAIQAYMTAVGA